MHIPKHPDGFGVDIWLCGRACQLLVIVRALPAQRDVFLMEHLSTFMPWLKNTPLDNSGAQVSPQAMTT